MEEDFTGEKKRHPKAPFIFFTSNNTMGGQRLAIDIGTVT